MQYDQTTSIVYEDMDKYERGGMNVQREPGLDPTTEICDRMQWGGDRPGRDARVPYLFPYILTSSYQVNYPLIYSNVDSINLPH